MDSDSKVVGEYNGKADSESNTVKKHKVNFDDKNYESNDKNVADNVAMGTTLNTSCSLEQDGREKRSDFIDSVVNIRESFNFAHPSEIISATQIYCFSHYNSSLWNLHGQASEMFYAS